MTTDRQKVRVSASPAPAAGGLEAVRATLEEAKFALFCSDMTIKDRADQSIRLTLASLASSAASPASPNGAIIHAIASLAAAISLLERTPKAKKAAPSDRMFEQMLCDYRKALEEARAALASPAATIAETQGGDGVREAAELLSHLKLYVLEKLDQHDADALHDRMNDLTAALAPPTSAATRGEPVALTADDRRLLDKALEASTEHLYGFGKPAPGAQVKEAEQERNRLAKLVESMIKEPTFAKSPHARMAIAIAASNVRRGRLLTSSEKFDNLTSAIEEDDPDLAARIRASLDLATDAEG